VCGEATLAVILSREATLAVILSREATLAVILSREATKGSLSIQGCSTASGESDPFTRYARSG